MKKYCSKCKLEKDVSEFYKKKGYKLGVSPQCKKCADEGSAKAREKNPEHYAEVRRNWRQSHPEEMNEYKAKWLKANPDKRKEVTSAYIKRNSAKHLAQVRERQVRKLNALPTWANKKVMAQIYKEARSRSVKEGVEYHVDHSVPLKNPNVCGLHCEANLQIIPAKENLSKNNKWWPDMWED